MSDILCVTNRLLCKVDFESQIRKIAKSSPHGIILREKDLTESEYRLLARDVMRICEEYSVPCILHSFVDAAMELKAQAIHLPLPVLRKMNQSEKERFSAIGASCHSVEEAKEAEALGCTYLTAGHLFATDCKKGVPPRGLKFLKNVCEAVSVPVYAIGGIDSSNINSVRSAGAAGACVMSALMSCDDPARYLDSFREEGGNHMI